MGKCLKDFKKLINGCSDLYDYDYLDYYCIDRDISFLKIIFIPVINGLINGKPVVCDLGDFLYLHDYYSKNDSSYNEVVVYCINILNDSCIEVRGF